MIKKVKHVIKTQLTQGATPQKLAQSLSAGLLIGCFPLLGFTTALAGVVGVVFKLNHIVIQTAHYIMYPVQLLLIPVYIKTVSVIVDVGEAPVRPDLILQAFHQDWSLFLKTYAMVGVYAVILWIFLSAALFFVLTKIFVPAIERLSQFKG